MRVNIEKQKDGSYTAYNTDSGFTAIGIGSTVAEAKQDFENSLKEVMEACAENGIDMPAGIDDKPEYKFDVASLFEYYDMINMAAFARSINLNASLLRQYKNKETYVSDMQLKRIEDGLHTLGEELAHLKLV